MRTMVILALLTFLACEPEHEKASIRLLSTELRFSPASLNEEAAHKIVISGNSLSLKSIRESFLLVKYSGKDKLDLNGRIIGLEYSIKSIKRGREFELKPKNSLVGGLTYALYFKEKNAYYLKHKIYIKRVPPKILSHDLGAGLWPVVGKNRLYFSFIFDQEIILTEEDSVQLKSKEGEVLELDKIIVKSSKKVVEVQIKASQLQPMKQYYFEFKKIRNLDAREAPIKAQQLVVGREQLVFREHAPANFLTSGSGIELSWLLSNDHQAEIFFGEDEKALDCLGGPCPLDLETKYVNKEARGFLSRIFLPNLKAQTSYHVIVRARDHQGAILLAAGPIQTAVLSEISLTEILVNPLGKAENASEFIEYVNFSSVNRELSGLRLVIEDQENQRHQCPLFKKGGPNIWPPQSYLVIVGSDFDDSLLPIPDAAVLIRLTQKSLCGGLSNNKAKIIKLMEGENTLLDRYSGSLWPGSAGQSINKRESKGLDEADNYCYSKPDYGPTPGADRGQC